MRSHSPTSYSLSIVVTVLFLCIPIQAQSTSSIEGQVTDQNGAVVPGAEITVISSAISIHRKATTDQDGRYQVASLPMADYRIDVRAQGFQTQIVEDVRLEVARKTAQNFQLQIGDVSPTRGQGSQAMNTAGNREDAVNFQINGISLISIPAKRSPSSATSLAAQSCVQIGCSPQQDLSGLIAQIQTLVAAGTLTQNQGSHEEVRKVNFDQEGCLHETKRDENAGSAQSIAKRDRDDYGPRSDRLGAVRHLESEQHR